MQRYDELRTVVKKLHRRKKREHNKRILAQAEGSFARNDARKFYKTINSTRKKGFPAPVMINDRQGNITTYRSGVAARWKEHFEVLLNGQASKEDTNRIRIEDEEATRELKNGKAAGRTESRPNF